VSSLLRNPVAPMESSIIGAASRMIASSGVPVALATRFQLVRPHCTQYSLAYLSHCCRIFSGNRVTQPGQQGAMFHATIVFSQVLYKAHGNFAT
jgi:hypothetical protein